MELAVVALLIIVYLLFNNVLERWNVTGPMLFVAAGALFFGSSDELDVDSHAVHTLAELTLVVVLFHDASTVQLRRLAQDRSVPMRLLLIGFPVAVVATLFVSWGLVPALGAAGALLVAASITPTDAGLGAPTVLNPVVPLRVRRALNVESGLNDGLATPLVLFALAILAAEEGVETPSVLSLSVVPVVLALAIAVVVAALAAAGLAVSRKHGWSSAFGRSLIIAATPLLAAGLAEVVGANVFITAFVAGLLFGAWASGEREEPEVFELLGEGADVLGFVVWFLAGGLVMKVFAEGFEPVWVLVAVLALTVLRMGPVALSLIGVGFNWRTVAFIGWFGPRGLATVVFGLLAVDELGLEHPMVLDIAGILAVTVLLSVLLHGVSAGPLSRRYGAWASGDASAPESKEVAEPRSRGRRPVSYAEPLDDEDQIAAG